MSTNVNADNIYIFIFPLRHLTNHQGIAMKKLEKLGIITLSFAVWNFSTHSSHATDNNILELSEEIREDGLHEENMVNLSLNADRTLRISSRNLQNYGGANFFAPYPIKSKILTLETRNLLIQNNSVELVESTERDRKKFEKFGRGYGDSSFYFIESRYLTILQIRKQFIVANNRIIVPKELKNKDKNSISRNKNNLALFGASRGDSYHFTNRGRNTQILSNARTISIAHNQLIVRRDEESNRNGTVSLIDGSCNFTSNSGIAEFVMGSEETDLLSFTDNILGDEETIINGKYSDQNPASLIINQSDGECGQKNKIKLQAKRLEFLRNRSDYLLVTNEHYSIRMFNSNSLVEWLCYRLRIENNTFDGVVGGSGCKVPHMKGGRIDIVTNHLSIKNNELSRTWQLGRSDFHSYDSENKSHSSDFFSSIVQLGILVDCSRRNINFNFVGTNPCFEMLNNSLVRGIGGNGVVGFYLQEECEVNFISHSPSPVSMVLRHDIRGYAGNTSGGNTLRFIKMNSNSMGKSTKPTAVGEIIYDFDVDMGMQVLEPNRLDLKANVNLRVALGSNGISGILAGSNGDTNLLLTGDGILALDFYLDNSFGFGSENIKLKEQKEKTEDKNRDKLEYKKVMRFANGDDIIHRVRLKDENQILKKGGKSYRPKLLFAKKYIYSGPRDRIESLNVVLEEVEGDE